MLQRTRPLLAYGGIATGAILAMAALANPAHAEVMIAYCDAPYYAINVFREGDPEASDGDLNIRIFYRDKSVIMIDTPAVREPNPEGYTYRNRSGENVWTLFVPNSEASACTLARDGELVTSGDVTQREPSSTGAFDSC